MGKREPEIRDIARGLVDGFTNPELDDALRPGRPSVDIIACYIGGRMHLVSTTRISDDCVTSGTHESRLVARSIGSCMVVPKYT
ncbi:MAG: hypothetical protein ACYDHH_24620 [Solirubrobacteraceae bacterium]